MAKKVNKRGNGEGTITQRPDGRWMAQITTGRDYETGKPKRVTLYGKTRREVQEKLTETIHSCQNGTFTEPNKLTFGSWMDIWLNQYAKPHIRPTTFTSYNRWIKNHIKPALGGIYLKDLQPNQIQRFYNEKLLEKKKIKEGTILLFVTINNHKKIIIIRIKKQQNQ
jgi:integrase